MKLLLSISGDEHEFIRIFHFSAKQKEYLERNRRNIGNIKLLCFWEEGRNPEDW